MTRRTERWIECDHGYCTATYHQSRQQQLRTSTSVVRSLVASAVAEGWFCEDGRDLCIYHAERRLGERARPTLFAVPDGDHQV